LASAGLATAIGVAPVGCVSIARVFVTLSNRAWWLAALAMAWGCNQVAGVDDLHYLGGTGGTTSTSSSSTSAGQGGSAGGGGTSQPCVVPFTDTFEGSGMSPDWIAFGEGTVGVEDGVLWLEPQGTSAAGTGVMSPVIDISGCEVSIELVEAFSSGVPGALALSVVAFGESWASIEIFGGDIYSRVVIVGEVVFEMMTTYDVDDHRWLRISEGESDGEPEVRFEASPDGVSWSSMGAATTPLAATQAQVYLWAALSDQVATPERVRFDNVNNLPQDRP
jgi:hypothetical protein